MPKHLPMHLTTVYWDLIGGKLEPGGTGTHVSRNLAEYT